MSLIYGYNGEKGTTGSEQVESNKESIEDIKEFVGWSLILRVLNYHMLVL